MSAKRVLIFGNMSMSLIMNMYKVPSIGETLIDDGGVAYIPSGEGAGCAMTFARLGADAVLAGKIGADSHGQRLYKYYKDAGLNTSQIKVDREEPTALTVIMREAGGERTLVYPGAGARYTADNAADAMSISPDGLYIGFGLPWQLIENVTAVAARRGVPIFVDASPAQPEQALESLPTVEIFSMGEAEAARYTGVAPVSAESSLRAALATRKRVDAKYVVIRQGERGAFIYDGRRYYVIGGAKAGKVVDPSYSAETFGAALTLEYLRTADIRAAVEYAVAASAIAASREGALGSVPNDAEVRSFMLKSGFAY